MFSHDVAIFADDRTERPDSPMLDVEGVSADEEDQGEPTNRRHMPRKCCIYPVCL